MPGTPEKPTKHAEFRKLWPNELALLRDHLQRLDRDTRRMRFGNAVGDRFIETYCDTVYALNSVIYGCFIDGTLRAVAELRLLNDTWPFEAELAFSVEKDWQDDGIGTDLMGRALQAAKNRGIGRLYMICLPENIRMRTIAQKYDARMSWRPGQIEGRLHAPYADYLSLFQEALDDAGGFVTFMLDLGHARARPEPRSA